VSTQLKFVHGNALIIVGKGVEGRNESYENKESQVHAEVKKSGLIVTVIIIGFDQQKSIIETVNVNQRNRCIVSGRFPIDLVRV
jgi:hypothetical protein